MGAWSDFKKSLKDAEKKSAMRKKIVENRKAARVENAPIQVGDQVLIIRTKGRVKKGNKGVCTLVHPTGGTLVYEIMFDIGFITGNMANAIKLKFTEIERELYLVKLNT